jgi:hypothetical protein
MTTIGVRPRPRLTQSRLCFGGSSDADRAHKIDPKRLNTHRFKLDSIFDAMTPSGTRPKQKRSR